MCCISGQTRVGIRAKASGLAAGVTYALSKRTRLYGALLDGDVENGAGVTTTDRRLYSVGVRHDF